MPIPTILVDPTPCKVERVPFASESSLHRFVEENCERLLGLTLLASARRGGEGVFKIDVLAADRDGRLWIIECKRDLVDFTALRQIRKYQERLIKKWAAVKERLQARTNVVLSLDSDPALVLIGYRFDDTIAANQCVRLVYRYHDVEFTGDEVQTRSAGRVSLHNKDDLPGPDPCPPTVSKKSATTRRLQEKAPALEESFWKIDADLQRLKGVKVYHCGKNVVRYSTRAGVFAEAVIGDGVIHWHITSIYSMHSDSDTGRVLKVLQSASGKAG